MLRGAEAFTRLRETHRFNDPAKPGHEWVLFKIRAWFVSGPSDAVLYLDGGDLSVFSSAGDIYFRDLRDLVEEPEPDFDLMLSPGASGEGWQAWQVAVDDPYPLLVFGAGYDYREGLWLALYEGKTVPPAGIPTPPPASGSQLSRLRFTGNSPVSSRAFELTQGLYKATGESGVVRIGTTSGVIFDLSPGDSSLLGPGDYVLEVTARGQWSVRIERISLDGAELVCVPFSLLSRGTTVSPIIRIGERPHRFTGAHYGTSSFIVRLYSLDGEQHTLIFDEMGAFNGSTDIQFAAGALFDLPPGDYVLAVDADGDWTLKIE